MNKKLIGILGIILSVLTLIYFEPLSYKVIEAVGIDLNKFSLLFKTIINLIIKFVMCFIIYLIFKKDFRKNRSSFNLVKNILILIVSVILLVIGMYFVNYVIKFIGDIFNISITESSFYNVFNKTLDFNLIVKIIIDYIITPYLYCTIIILGMEKFSYSVSASVLLSGLLAGIIHALMLKGTLGFVIVNSISTFILFTILTFIYKKGMNIWFIISTYSFYLLTNVIIINYLGW